MFHKFVGLIHIKSESFLYPVWTLLQSDFVVIMIDSSKPKIRSSKLHNVPNDSSYISEKIHSLKQTHKGYCSELTKTMNRIIRIIFENHSSEKVKVYEYQLDNIISKLENIYNVWIAPLRNQRNRKKNILSFFKGTDIASFWY